MGKIRERLKMGKIWRLKMAKIWRLKMRKIGNRLYDSKILGKIRDKCWHIENIIEDGLWEIGYFVLTALKGAAISLACFVPWGALAFSCGVDLAVTQAQQKKEAFQAYTTSAEYAEEYNAAKEAELERYEQIEEDVVGVQQEFLNGKMTLKELEGKIEALRRQIVYGDELDRRLFNNTNNPTIVATKEKAKDLRTASIPLIVVGALAMAADVVTGFARYEWGADKIRFDL